MLLRKKSTSCDWYIAELKEKNVPIHMETEFTPDMADSGKYDTVILAVGATPIMPASIEGVEKAISAVELLENHSDVGETVVVVGGGMVGCSRFVQGR
jgi:2-enoate reductase